MKLKLLCSRAGVGFSQNVGDEIEVGDAEGLRMIDAGQAVLVDLNQSEAARIAEKEKSQTETATKKVSTEKAVKK